MIPDEILALATFQTLFHDTCNPTPGQLIPREHS